MIDRRFLLTMKRSYVQLADGARTDLEKTAYGRIIAEIERALAA